MLSRPEQHICVVTGSDTRCYTKTVSHEPCHNKQRQHVRVKAGFAENIHVKGSQNEWPDFMGDARLKDL
jgi:hypothetical protein